MNKQHSKEKVQLVNELHKPIRRNFKRRSTIIKGLDDLWQADLAQMDLYSSSNKNYKFILVVIDCFSKYAWARALKTKTSHEVTEAFKSILVKEKRQPKNLQTDQGKEFFNNEFGNLMKKYNINHYNTYSIKKASMAERFIRTLKERLFKYFSLNGSYKWIDILPSIVSIYNNTVHSTIQMKPINVTKTKEKQLLASAYNQIKIATDPRKFVIGDIVRISKAKYVFSKGYTPNWTTELFKIVKINITDPVTYILEDLQGNPIMGAFYKEELQKTETPDVYLIEKILKRRGNKVFVKWLGFDNTHNSWINKTNIL